MDKSETELLFIIERGKMENPTFSTMNNISLPISNDELYDDDVIIAVSISFQVTTL